jgi:hypothetical protein
MSFDHDEPCWTGVQHTSQNFKVWVQAGGHVYAWCFGCRALKHLGSMDTMRGLASDSDVVIKLPELVRIGSQVADPLRPQTTPLPAPRRVLAMPGCGPADARQAPVTSYYGLESGGTPAAEGTVWTYVQHSQVQHRPISSDPHVEKLNTVLDRFMVMDIRALGLQSPMGTGKTQLIRQLQGELDRHGTGATCLLAYRKTLSRDLHRALADLGFVNYLDMKGEGGRDLSACPRIIIQVDSVRKLFGCDRRVPHYNLVVVDESESLLHHCTAQTLGTNQPHVLDALVSVLHAADRTLWMDAFLGAETRAFIKAAELPPLTVVRNDWRPPPEKRRTFVLHSKRDQWRAGIASALRDGKNVWMACMSMRAGRELKDELMAEAGLAEDEVLVLDRMTDDSIGRRMADVNEFWSQYRLVICSPTVEAGVSFTLPHFHMVCGVVCRNSTTPLAFMQMTHRVRQVVSPEVPVLCLRTPTDLDDGGELCTPEDAWGFFAWSNEYKRALNGDVCAVGEPGDEHAMTFCLKWQAVRTTDGTQRLLPVRGTPQAVLACHNYARIYNSKRHFIPVLSALIAHAGHTVEMHTADTGADKRSSGGCGADDHSRMKYLLAARPIHYSEATEVESKMKWGVATEHEKWQLERYNYCKSWGINNFADHQALERFVSDRGTKKAPSCSGRAWH